MLLFLLSYAPNLNLIERLWKFIKEDGLYSRYYGAAAQFRAAIYASLVAVNACHQPAQATLLTLRFQTFSNTHIQAE